MVIIIDKQAWLCGKSDPQGIVQEKIFGHAKK